MLKTCAILRLLRPDSSFLVFFLVFLPLLTRTGDLGDSLLRALPILFIGMITFIINDVHDIETDKINHPDRPLPSRQLRPDLAIVVYFLFIALTLITIKIHVEESYSSLYYTLLMLAISYNYVAEHVANAKPFYVAATSAFPVLIIVRYHPDDKYFYLIGGCIFSLVVGRELCMDFLDKKGDIDSFTHRLTLQSLALIVSFSQAFAVIMLAAIARTPLALAALIAIACLSVMAGLTLFKRRDVKKCCHLIKLQLASGLCFLL